MRVTKFHPELAPPPLGQNFDEGTEPTGNGWVDHPSEFPNTKVHLYHPWKAPRGETFEQGHEPTGPGWVTAKRLLPPLPDPVGPLHHEKRVHALIEVAEVLRVRGYPQRPLRAQLKAISDKECAPPVEDHILDEITEGAVEIPGALVFRLVQEVASELARQGMQAEDAYEALKALNARRGNNTLSDEDLHTVCTSHF